MNQESENIEFICNDKSIVWHRLDFPIDPVPKGRPRKGRFSVYTPKKTRDAEKDIRTLARMQWPYEPLTDALHVQILFIIKRGPSVKRKHPDCRPDVDNIAKLALDSLNSIVWKDDSQIIKLELEKRYGENGRILLRFAKV